MCKRKKSGCVGALDVIHPVLTVASSVLLGVNVCY
jgi:hypothetical protein